MKQALSARVAERLEALQQQPGGRGLIEATPPADAPTLAQHLQRQGPLAPETWLNLALRLTQALSALHHLGVQHRAIQPEHVLWPADAVQSALTGLAQATTSAQEQPGFTHHSQLTATLAYCAPEQTGRAGLAVDQRADLYALGATLYAAATGHPPFVSDDPLQLIHQHLSQPAPHLSERAPHWPADWAAVTMKLLAKSPDDRYQSAQGLLIDLTTLQNRQAHPSMAQGPFILGLHDHAAWLSPPGHLVGRDAEIARLAEAFEQAQHSAQHTVLVDGAPGVGKSALLNTLRPLVTARRGWFVSAKFDQLRQDADAHALRQALRALGRLLLSEPDEQLARQRQQLRQALGAQLPLVTDMLPEFALLMGEGGGQTSSEDVLLAEHRQAQALVTLLRTIVSPERPLVMVIDDLQWAGAPAIRAFDALAQEAHLRGLLLVGAFRSSEVHAAHPLQASLTRWARQAQPPARMALQNLPPADLSTLLAGMLRLGQAQADRLAEAIAPRTGGNPFDTVELVNALRRDHLLNVAPDGWHWDPKAIAQHVGQSEVIDLLQARMAQLPEATQSLMHDMACLGGELPQSLLAQACALSPDALVSALVPALDQGLVLLQREGEAEPSLRFRHDRVQQAAHAMMAPQALTARHLKLARQLAGQEAQAALAAEQYLHAIELIEAPQERLAAATLLLQAARQLRLVHHERAARLSLAGLALLPQTASPLHTALATEAHLALHNQGQLDEADAIFAQLQAWSPQPLEAVHATCLQIASLTHRARGPEAVSLGVEALKQLGHPVPDGVQELVQEGLQALRQACRPEAIEASTAHDLDMAETQDPTLIAVAQVLDRLLIPSLQCNPAVNAWLAIESRRLWTLHGPSPALVRAAALSIPLVLASRLGAYREARAIARQTLTVSEARGYEVATATARHVYAIATQHWGGPVEDSIQQARDAHEALVRGGDLQFACLTYHATLPALLDSAPQLSATEDDLRSGLAFAQRTGNQFALGLYTTYRQLVRALQREPAPDGATPGAFQDADFDEAQRQTGKMALGTMGAVFHVLRALSAGLFGDLQALRHHSEASLPMLGAMPGFHPTAWARALHGWAMAEALRAVEAPVAQRHHHPALAALDADLEWLHLRAQDMPANYQALAQWLAAEKAWALGDGLGAMQSFNAATQSAHAADANGDAWPASPRRPWQHALICERSAACHDAHQLSASAHALRLRACQAYADWGATAKVRAMQDRHPGLASDRHASTLAADVEAAPPSPAQHAIDLMAVVRASQLLSSETGLERLTRSVSDILAAMTGATRVQLLTRDAGSANWQAAAARPDDAPLPTAALRFVERTRAPLLVPDVTQDERFQSTVRDARQRPGSALVLPVLGQGQLQALLLLENHLGAGRFSAEQLDTVLLVAAQLAVSLDNARVYGELEARVQARTRELRELQASLVDTARRAGMAEIATNVLHNVGNVLNSVNVSADVIGHRLRHTKAAGFGKAVALMAEHEHDLGHFFTQDDKGKRLPGYLHKLVQTVTTEHSDMLQELDQLIQRVDHIKEIVAMQQSYAGHSSLLEPIRVASLIQDALQMNEAAMARHKVHLEARIADLPSMQLDRPRVLQILMNLLSNAKQACSGPGQQEGRVQLDVDEVDGQLRMRVKDNGVGIRPEHLTRIFAHGFTTKPDGHGFGLHSCVLAARDMGGSLEAQSEGPGLGATFTLKLPARHTADLA
ncbi:MAG: hypothetical protein RI907_1784 [Pseudomonadota bacterium]|jgi:predicted ATPase/signal transduction histidine kinase